MTGNNLEGGLTTGSKKRLVGDRLLFAISIFASIGVFLFGFDQGVMSGLITNPYFVQYFNHPTPGEIGTMVAILEIGAFVTSLLAGTLGDKIGRRLTLLLGALIFTVGGTIQTITIGYKSMVLGRIISGLGVGFLSMIVPVYQSEISLAENRGKLACIEFTGNIVGYATSVWLDYFSSYIPSDTSWRFPLSIQVLIGLILALGTLYLPESPRHLLSTSQDVLALKVLADLHGDGNEEGEKVMRVFEEIKEGVRRDRKEGDGGYREMWTRYRGRVIIACSAQAFAQLNGINLISYYAPLVFESAGWIGRNAILMTGINSLIYILSTIPTWYLVDTWGRRPILLSGALVMAVALSAIGWFLYMDKEYTPVAVVGSVVVFNAAFGFSWGPVPWLYPPEILPNLYRVKGVSLSTATNWFFNWVVGEGTPVLQQVIGWRLYPMHAFFCLCSFVIVFFFYPETMGVELEEMDRLFGDAPIGDPESTSLLNSQSQSFLQSQSESHRTSTEEDRL